MVVIILKSMSVACKGASVVSKSVRPHGLQPTRLLCPWDSPGKNAGMGCHFLLQGIFPTQGSNPRLLCLLHWQAGSLTLVPPGKPLKCIKTSNHYVVHQKHSVVSQLYFKSKLIGKEIRFVVPRSRGRTVWNWMKAIKRYKLPVII